MERVNGARSLSELRQHHPTFTYQKFSFELRGTDLHTTFFFHTDPDLDFTTEVIFHHIPVERFHTLPAETLNNFLLNIGMIEGFSYWKATCSPQYIIEAGYFSPEQLHFWHDLLQKGMSEFFFVNTIDGWQSDFVQFLVKTAPQKSIVDTISLTDQVIVPMGGGKDSIVSLEVLKNAGTPLATLAINETDRTHAINTQANVIDQLKITRQLDPLIRNLNSRGYLNGHTPFSAMASFVISFAAYLHDYRYVAVSNEWSANEGNILFLGKQINHQYSKSLEYETAFRAYLRQYLSSSLEFFSFLRPLHEIQIANIFARYPAYFPLFLSCNRGQKEGRWCGECPKCLFVYIMLSPFVPQAELEKIWGQNLLAKESLKPILDELAGVVELKSLECVGTREETLLALALTLEKLKGQNVPPLLLYAQQKILATNYAQLITQANTFLHQLQTPNFVPPHFLQLLAATVHDE